MLSKKTNSNYKIYATMFVGSLVILNLFHWLSIMEGINNNPNHLLYFISPVFLLIALFYFWHYHQKIIGGAALRMILFIFVVWSLLLLIGSFRIDSSYFKNILRDRYFFIPFLLSLIILYSRFEVNFFKLFLSFTYRLIFFGVITQAFILFTLSSLYLDNFYELIHRIWIFDLGSALLLLTAHLYKKKGPTYIVLIYYLINLFLSAYFGRRGLMFDILLLLSAMVIIRLKSTSTGIVRRVKILLIMLVLIVVLVRSFGFLTNNLYVFKKGFTQKAWDVSRGQVMDDFFKDFNTTTDWTFGRGLNGTILRRVEWGTNQGTTIENGFLFVIFKGGLLYLLPMMFIFFRSFYLGYFKSKNDLSKALAALIMIQVIGMVSFNLPDYAPRYILVFIAVSAGFNAKIRALTNKEIITYI